MEYQERLRQYKKQIEEGISKYLVYKSCKQQAVIDAMMYSTLGGGKRLRPLLLLEFCRLVGGQVDKAMPFAVAVEFLHTYSLVHDDMPCMDNDDLRRGKATNHRVFGEGLALLAGDGLMNLAYETMLNPANTVDLPIERVLNATFEIARQVGIHGMIGGQTMDMAEEEERTLEELNEIHALKTGALLVSTARAGVILGGGSAQQLAAAESYAQKFGLAFQIRDDLLDIIGDVKSLGKSIGRDMDAGKKTYIDFMTAEQCRREIERLTSEAVEDLGIFDDNAFLSELTIQLARRTD